MYPLSLKPFQGASRFNKVAKKHFKKFDKVAKTHDTLIILVVSWILINCLCIIQSLKEKIAPIRENSYSQLQRFTCNNMLVVITLLLRPTDSSHCQS